MPARRHARGLALARGAICPAELASGDRPHDHKRLGAAGDCVGQRGIRRLVGQIFLAGEEAHERPALLGRMVADRSAQHWVASLKRVDHRALRDRAFNLELGLALELGQHPQMGWKIDSDHGSV